MRHPDDLPEGYHTPARGQSCTKSTAGCVEGCPRAVARSGCAKSTPCPREAQRVQDRGPGEHQKGTTRPGTGLTAPGDTGRHGDQRERTAALRPSYGRAQ